jgi:hypothetical protein
LTERARRIWAATEARAAGWGGITGVARATGISYSTIQRGLQELKTKRPLAPGRVRRPGGGRKRTVDKDPTLLADLEGLVEPTASGDPMSPLRWTSKSVRQLASSLQGMGHQVSRQLVAELLATAGYSLQANRKTREGPAHPDRDAQFRYIAQQVRRFQAATQPVISVDTKKKELVGDFKNAGRQWRPKGEPTPVRVHDFLIPAHGKAIPYGVYDLTRNAGWVGVGIDHDTATFAVRTIGRWWRRMGQPRYRRARSVLITADAGGSNGSRVRLWKWELQELADRTGLAITVCHLPPRDQQVEQDRAPALLVHQHELARPAAGESGGDRQPDRSHPHHGGVARAVRTRPRRLPQRRDHHRHPDGDPPARASSLPRRLELHSHPAPRSALNRASIS